jgi:uncharacterized protein YndB with AHSA1/START domain
MDPKFQTFSLERIFDAPRQIVFDYFTIPALLCTWWGPQHVTTERVEMNLFPGGSCRWEMRDRENRLLILHGKIIEVVPPERLIMTHQWQNNPAVTTVTLEFLAIGEQTMVRLKQEGIATALPIKLYDDWWISTFTRLQRVIKD